MGRRKSARLAENEEKEQMMDKKTAVVTGSKRVMERKRGRHGKTFTMQGVKGGGVSKAKGSKNEIKVTQKNKKRSSRVTRRKKADKAMEVEDSKIALNIKETEILQTDRACDEKISEEKLGLNVQIETKLIKTEVGPMKKIGAHVSISGGLHNAVTNALELDANAFGLFLRNQRQWASKPLADEDAEKFKKACTNADFSPNQILPHGIYLMNCASPDEESLAKSRATLIDELKRCEKLGLTLYNFHPGSTCGKTSVEEGIERIAQSINAAHRETKYVITLIENMCCQGHTIGGKFEELKGIIDKVEDKTRIGVCFDTCHAFAAGYDITGKEQLDHTMELFDNIVGLNYLKAVHLNDSKGECGCHLDRHENIGHGKIGIRGFKALMNDARFDNIPMILETPECDYKKEIGKLYSLAGTQ